METTRTMYVCQATICVEHQYGFTNTFGLPEFYVMAKNQEDAEHQAQQICGFKEDEEDGDVTGILTIKPMED